MKIAVCVKQIPDPASPQKLDASFNLARDGKLIMDETDSFGVEMALQLVDAAGSGEVVVFSMAPRSEMAGIRNALAMGAHRGVLVSDDALAGSDALSTAKVLAKAIGREPFDLVIAGTESSDGYTGTLPVQIAELLGMAAVTFAKKVQVEGGSLKVERQTEAGYDEVASPLPAVVTVTSGVVEPRYPSFKGIMAAKSKPVETLGVADLGLTAGDVGKTGAREEVSSVREAEARAAGAVVVDEGDAFNKVVEYLEQIKVI
ncbi:MAG: electron transfer flavoprotein subunit beta/FixA family protein [Actinomycetota bacterium]|nr:electron transfer flavoprotein subunit beta/FixA family protein [Actinomycetota bacterium]